MAYGKLYKIFLANEETFKPLATSKKAKDKASEALQDVAWPASPLPTSAD